MLTAAGLPRAAPGQPLAPGQGTPTLLRLSAPPVHPSDLSLQMLLLRGGLSWSLQANSGPPGGQACVRSLPAASPTGAGRERARVCRVPTGPSAESAPGLSQVPIVETGVTLGS